MNNIGNGNPFMTIIPEQPSTNTANQISSPLPTRLNRDTDTITINFPRQNHQSETDQDPKKKIGQKVTYTFYTKTMESELKKLISLNTKNDKIDWDTITREFNKRFIGADCTRQHLMSKFIQLKRQENASHPLLSIQQPTMTDATTAKTANAIQSIISPENIEKLSNTEANTATKRRKYIRYTPEMTRILRELVSESKKEDCALDWDTITHEFNKKFPGLDSSTRSLKRKYDQSVSENVAVQSQPLSELSDKYSTIPTKSVTSTEPVQPPIAPKSEEMQNTETKGITQNIKKYSQFTPEMISAIEELVKSNTDTRGKRHWILITSLFNLKFPEIQITHQRLSTLYERRNQKNKVKKAKSSKTEATSQQSITSTTNPVKTRSKQIIYTKEMKVELIKLAEEHKNSKGKPDWKIIKPHFNEKFPDFNKDQKSLAVKYRQLREAKNSDRKNLSKTMEDDLLRICDEKIDKQIKIEWKEIQKEMNSKYNKSIKSSKYKSIYIQLKSNSELTESDHSDSELTASDHSDKEASDI